MKRLLGRKAPSNKAHRRNRSAGVPPETPDRPMDIGPVRLLSAAPPVFLSGIPSKEYLGIAPSFALRHGNLKAGFVIFPSWSLERPGVPEAIRRKVDNHSERYPEHRFHFVCNTPEETRLLEELGLTATFLNKNFMVSDQVFRPVQGAKVEFDAVYNARFLPVKRHELAAEVPRVAYLAYVEGGPQREQQFRLRYKAAMTRSPDHMLLNELVDGLPVGMSHEQVNAALSRAAVGLVLSEVEGSSYAAVEYLLAGLPVVSTPSKGGRDVFFDPDYCIVCEPNSAAVRDAVAALRARNVPREVVRARTLAKIQPDRQRLLALVDDLIEELGGERQYRDGAWPFSDTSGVPWRPFEAHLAEFAARLRIDREGRSDSTP